jgi:hypothetical protein
MSIILCTDKVINRPICFYTFSTFYFIYTDKTVSVNVCQWCVLQYRVHKYFSLWLCGPILGTGRLHETFRVISVTTSTTVSRTPWTSYQLVVRPLRICPGWLWGWRCWWNERICQGKPKYLEKMCPDTTLSITNPTCQTQARTRAAAVGSQRLTASAHKYVSPLIFPVGQNLIPYVYILSRLIF